MKDIDFDELDRAVNSLMSTGGSAQAARQTDGEAVDEASQGDNTQGSPVGETPVVTSENDLLTTHESSQQEEVQSEAVAPTPQPEATTTPTPPVTTRGRFMDVMRPSSDEAKKAGLMKAPSRQGATLQPLSGASGITTESAASSEPAAEPQVDVTPDKEENPFDAIMEAALAEENAAINNEASDSDMQALGSPFLPDAKVEKRPLGRPAGEVADTTPEVASNESDPVDSSAAPATDTMPSSADTQLPEQPLPPELDSNLLSIETGADTVAAPVSQEAMPEPQPAAPTPVATETAVPSPAVAASIPQQYKLQPTPTEEAPTNAIYDTQPLAHPAKKTSGLLWIAGIIAVILLGVGGGAAIYYLGLL